MPGSERSKNRHEAVFVDAAGDLGRRLRVQPQPHEVFEMTALNTLFPIVASEAEALAVLPG